MKKLLITLSLAATAICQADPIQISVTGTADSTVLGYTSGQSYTFNWVINESYSPNASDFFNSSRNIWKEETTSESMLFSSISGDGLTGTFVQPSASIDSPSSSIFNLDSSPDIFLLKAGRGVDGSTGMQVDGNDLRLLEANSIQLDGMSFSGAYSDPETYWSNYAGTYALSSGEVRVYTEPTIARFSPTSMTIAAIPEPATFAFVGIFGGGIFAVRRFFPSV